MSPQYRIRRLWSAPRLRLKECESVHTQQSKSLTPLRGIWAYYRISKLAGCFLELRVHTVTYSGPDGQTSWLIPRIELKEMENKPPMETIMEEGEKHKPRKCKLNDQTDKVEVARGMSLV